MSKSETFQQGLRKVKTKPICIDLLQSLPVHFACIKNPTSDDLYENP